MPGGRPGGGVPASRARLAGEVASIARRVLTTTIGSPSRWTVRSGIFPTGSSVLRMVLTTRRNAVRPDFEQGAGVRVRARRLRGQVSALGGESRHDLSQRRVGDRRVRVVAQDSPGVGLELDREALRDRDLSRELGRCAGDLPERITRPVEDS